MASVSHVFDVDTASFEEAVLERSHETTVIVDFWAEWCGPCRTLGPTLEAAVGRRDGDVVLAKVDVDDNQQLAQQFRVQGIPAVKAFRDGRVVDEFTGAINEQQVEAFLDGVVPSAADRLVSEGRRLVASDPAAARAAHERALQEDPTHVAAALGLADLLVEEDPDRATELVTPHRPDPRAETVLQRISLAAGAGDLEALSDHARAHQDDDAAMLPYGRALAAADLHTEAIEVLLHGIGLHGDHKDELRGVLLDLLDVLGDEDPRVPDARRRLARLLF